MTDTRSQESEVRADLTGADWFKSSHSGGEQACVEVADLRRSPHRSIAVRDSKNPGGPALLLDPAVFAGFVAEAAAGEYDINI